MRSRLLFSMIVLSAMMLVISTRPAESQKRGFGGPPGGGAGGPPGGGFGGGKGGFGGGKGGGMVMGNDPDKLFDYLSKGRGFFLITDTRSMRDELTKYAADNRIANGQITREQFTAYLKAKTEALRTQTPPTPGADPKGPPPPMTPGGPGGPDRNETLMAWAETEFKRRDRNDDGYLNKDEMPEPLRDEISKWDKNNDTLISLNEFRGYFQDRIQSGRREDATASVVTRIIEEENLEIRPTVYRAGKLPKELPSWFQELDKDKDGQVSLFEWRGGSKELEEFTKYDHNDDGLMTAEEVLKQQAVARAATLSGSGGTSAMARDDERPRGEGKWGGFGKGGGFGGGGGAFGGGNGAFGGGNTGFGNRDGGKGGKGGFKFEFKRPK